jgi:hypothetical protein
MRTSLVRVGVSLGVALLLALGVACEEESTADKQATACEELTKLDAAQANLDAIGPTSTVEQLKDARNELKEQAEDTRRAIREYNESKAEDLENTVENLNKAVSDISSGDSIAEARASIQDELAAVQEARVKLRADLRCP